VRGNDITMIFQEPMTSLNPLHTVERQIGEMLKVHQGMREMPRASARWSCSTRWASAMRKAG
jgi:ABC-type microcin C transport system duplicated ATPase subunit YejF